MLSENLANRDNQQINALSFWYSHGTVTSGKDMRYPVISETEKAWLAGFLDADGMIRLRIGQKNKVGPRSLVPIVTYTNTCALTVKRLCELIGLSFTDFAVSAREEVNRKTWATKLTIEIAGVIRVLPFLKMVRPYMVTKATEADLTIRFCEHRTAHNRKPYGDLEYRTFEALKYCKRSRHLRDFALSVEQVLDEDKVRSNAEALAVAEMSTRLPIEAQKEWARNLVSRYRWHKTGQNGK